VYVCDSHRAGCSEVLRYTDIAYCWNIQTAAGISIPILFFDTLLGKMRNVDSEKLIIELLPSVLWSTPCVAQWVQWTRCFNGTYLFLYLSAATWPFFFTRGTSANCCWQEFWHNRRCVELMATIYVTLSSLKTNPNTDQHTLYYSTCWYQIRETVCPTLSANCTFT
jgi:hypothetical protein